MAAALTAIIFGATGATGKHVLKEVLQSDRFTKVGEYGRSVTPESKLPAGRDKLEQKIIDYEKLEQVDVKQGNWDVVLITLGTTRAKAGTAEAFEKIDREYVLNAARAAKSDDPSRKQRLIYVSAAGADSKSHFLYPRSKGLTETGLASLGYDDVIIFRPGMLLEANRGDAGFLERIADPIAAFLGKFTDKTGITVAHLGKSVRLAGELGSEGIPADLKSTETVGGHPITAVSNSQAFKLAQKF